MNTETLKSEGLAKGEAFKKLRLNDALDKVKNNSKWFGYKPVMLLWVY